MFKEKTSKKRQNISGNSKEISTLDVMHNKMIQTFSAKTDEKKYYENLLNEMLAINSNIKLKIDDMHLSGDLIEYDTLWTSNIEITEEIINIKKKIKDIEEYDEIEYYKKTSNILFDYYDMIEKQSKIVNKNDNIMNNKSRTILDALNNTENENNNPKKDDDIIVSNNIDKSSLVDEYLFQTNKQHVKKYDYQDLELCKICNNPMTCLQHEAIAICDKCGFQELLLVEQNRPILKHNTKDTSHFSYKRINHFREWCNQVQGKESTDIPDEIFEKILNEIKKEKITDTKKITYNKMREILKRLRINKYYEHINYIINRINGIPTPQFSPQLEDKLCNMFRDIQGPFLKHCPKERKNFLSYSYVLYKFFQILKLNEYLKYFPLLKSREKLYVQDQIWKKICEELNYEFIQSPSI